VKELECNLAGLLMWCQMVERVGQRHELVTSFPMKILYQIGKDWQGKVVLQCYVVLSIVKGGAPVLRSVFDSERWCSGAT